MRSPDPPGGGERLYRLLLRLYPRRFRAEYEADLIQAYRDRREERRFRGPLGRLRLAVYLLVDLGRSLPLAHRRQAPAAADRHGRPTTHHARQGHTGTRMTMGNLIQDLRFALRAYLRRPGFTVASIVTLALGVGASTTVFSIADGVALRSLPYPDAERLVAVGAAYEGRERPGSTTPADFFDWQARSRSFDAMTASRLERLTFLGEGTPTPLSGAGVSSEFFDVFGVEPALGRVFTEEEDRPEASPVAVLAHGLWERRFGADPDILGRTLAFDGRSFTVVGVMHSSFRPPEGVYHGDVEVWYPLAHVREDLDQRRSAFLQIAGRLADGATPESARRELQGIADLARSEEPDAGPLRTAVAPLRRVTVGDVGSTLTVLLGAVGLLLLIACANVTNLFLVRASERDREMALRTAMGAERNRLVGQLLTEGLLLALVAGVLATGIAYGGLAVFKAFNPGDIPRLSEVGIHPRVLAFALGLSLSTGLLAGLVPLVRVTEAGISAALREGSPAASPGSRAHRLRSLLVVGQTGVALVLLVGAGLLMNSFVRLLGMDPGFEPQNAVHIQVTVAAEDYPTAEERVAFFTRVERRFEAVPGVESVGGTENLPLGRNRSVTFVSPESLDLAPDDAPPLTSFHRVTPGFFQALGTPLLRGRTFTESDDAGSPRVAVVNRTMAEAFWPGEDPLGRRLKEGRPDGDAPWWTVVGVVGDVRQQGLATAPEPELYTAWRQSPRTNVTFVVRGPGATADLLPVLSREVWAVDPTLPIRGRGTLAGHLAASVVEPRFYTLVLSAFAGLALVLALVGLYGTMAYTVERRTHELGVRMALGAGRKRVLAEVLRRGAVLLATGLVLGLGGALVSTRALEGLVFGVTPTDPATLVATTVALGAAGLLACWLPARRATRLDPVRALRHD